MHAFSDSTEPVQLPALKHESSLHLLWQVWWLQSIQMAQRRPQLSTVRWEGTKVVSLIDRGFEFLPRAEYIN